jgi:hypothetical protein
VLTDLYTLWRAILPLWPTPIRVPIPWAAPALRHSHTNFPVRAFASGSRHPPAESGGEVVPKPGGWTQLGEMAQRESSRRTVDAEAQSRLFTGRAGLVARVQSERERGGSGPSRSRSSACSSFHALNFL